MITMRHSCDRFEHPAKKFRRKRDRRELLGVGSRTESKKQNNPDLQAQRTLPFEKDFHRARNVMDFLGQVQTGQRWAIVDIDDTLTRIYTSAIAYRHLLASDPTLYQTNRATWQAGNMHHDDYVLAIYENIPTHVTWRSQLYKRGIARLGSQVDSAVIRRAGRYVGRVLVEENQIYSDAFTYLQRLADSGVQILFLTAGMQDYMEGVLEGIRDTLGIGFSFSLVGTTLEREPSGRVTGGFMPFAETKAAIAEQMVQRGAELVFAAGDSKRGDQHVQVTEKYGGKVLWVPLLVDGGGEKAWREMLQAA